MSIFVSLLLLTIGPILASFFALNIQRNSGATNVHGLRSHCDHCGHNLAWWELIPLISFPFLLGRCAHCRKPIEIRLWFSEILGFIAIAPLVMFADFSDAGGLANLLVHFVFATSLLYLAIYDLLTMTVPGLLTIQIVFLAIVFVITLNILRLLGVVYDGQIAWASMGNLLAAFIAAVFLGIIIFATKARAMGEGDILVGILIGLWLGWPQILYTLYFTIIVGGLIGVGYMVFRRKLQGMIPFVPCLLIGASVSIMFGEAIFRNILGVIL